MAHACKILVLLLAVIYSKCTLEKALCTYTCSVWLCNNSEVYTLHFEFIYVLLPNPATLSSFLADTSAAPITVQVTVYPCDTCICQKSKMSLQFMHPNADGATWKNCETVTLLQISNVGSQHSVNNTRGPKWGAPAIITHIIKI